VSHKLIQPSVYTMHLFNKAAGGWGKLHNEGLHNLYSLQNIIRVIK